MRSKVKNIKKKSKKPHGPQRKHANGLHNDFIKKLYSAKSRLSQNSLLSDLKHKYSYEDSSKIIDKLQKTYFKNEIFGNVLPKKYDNIGKKIDYNFLSSDIKIEISWMTLTIIKHSDIINEYLILMNKFNDSFVKGNYIESLNILDNIDKNICLSLWSIEKRLLVKEYKDGVESNKDFLFQLSKDKEYEIINFLADNLSKKIEKNLSPEKYDTEINLIFNQMVELGFVSNMKYYKFLLSFFSGELDFDLKDILYWSAEFSIIDRYNNFISVLELVSSSSLLDDVFIEKTATNLKEKIKDNRIENIIIYINPFYEVKIDQKFENKIKSIDYYASGNYEECINLTTQFMDIDPTDFEYYDLYVKSHIYLNKTISFGADNNIKNEIISIIFDIYSKNEDIDNSLSKLKKIIYTLGVSSLSISLFHVYSNESAIKIDKKYNIIYYLNLRHATPKLSKIYNDYKKSKIYLNLLYKKFPKSNAINMFNEVNNMVYLNESKLSLYNINETRKNLYLAKVLLSNERYEESIYVLKNIKLEVVQTKNYYQLDDICTNLFICYLLSKRIDDCIELYLECFFINKNLCKKLNLSRLISILESDGYDEVNFSIKIPLLFFIHYGLSQESYVAYDNFLFFLECEKASEILPKKLVKVDEFLIYFLSNICIPDIYYHSVIFEGTEDLEVERISLCQQLIEIDNERSSKYSEEIGEITKRSVIRKGIQQVEESKIYVDINGIKKSGFKVLSENFIRYREFASFSEKEEYTLFDWSDSVLSRLLGEERKLNDSHPEKLKNNISILLKGKAGYKLFKELFLDIRNRFISSNEHGLDSYLSVRIRHGTLLGHLRRQFDAENLITQKNDKDKYQINKFWNDKFSSLDLQAQDHLQSNFAELSNKIDLIIDKFKNKWLQIRTEKKNNEGLFNYIFEEYDLINLYNKIYFNINNYDDFIDQIFELLWKRTEVNLEEIKINIMTIIQPEIVNCLNEFQDNVKQFIPQTSEYFELSRSIATCRTNIQTELSNLTKWFTLSEGKLIHNFSLQMAVDTAVEIINNTYPNCKFYPQVKVTDLNKYDGKNFTAIIDILIILFNNIISHSNISDYKNYSWVKASNVAANIELEVGNGISNDKNTDEILDNMNRLKNSFLTVISTDSISKEGGSGIHKIINICKNVLCAQRSDISFHKDFKNCLIVKINISSVGMVI